MIANPIPSWLRRPIVLGTPLALGILELWHPRYFPRVFFDLLPRVEQWLTVHLLQLPLFGLLALAVYLLINGLSGLAATISRIALWFFIVFYTALDAIAGIATGILIRNASELPPDQQAIIARAVQALFFNPIAGGYISVISIIGLFGWIIAVFAAAIALYRAGAPRLPVILLALSFIFGVHPRPTGPLGMAFFFVAAVWLELVWQRSSLKNVSRLEK
ncbi:hypothetical protein IQ238_06230 [Pleurocapsales cyanobacterium LEGE 06147]|nr:hypothetical protein [Pleurocapsales cyanobacterium LEGE 06147]